MFAGDPAPRYIAFRDKRSKWVFRDLTSTGAYRVTNEGPLFCPDVPNSGHHGYVLGARVDRVATDSAYATVSKSCQRFDTKCPPGEQCVYMGGNSINYETTYLMVREDGRWRVEKPVGGAVIVPM